MLWIQDIYKYTLENFWWDSFLFMFIVCVLLPNNEKHFLTPNAQYYLGREFLSAQNFNPRINVGWKPLCATLKTALIKTLGASLTINYSRFGMLKARKRLKYERTAELWIRNSWVIRRYHPQTLWHVPLVICSAASLSHDQPSVQWRVTVQQRAELSGRDNYMRSFSFSITCLCRMLATVTRYVWSNQTYVCQYTVIIIS